MPKVTIVTKDRIFKMSANKNQPAYIYTAKNAMDDYKSVSGDKSAGIFPKNEPYTIAAVSAEDIEKFKQSWAKSPLFIESFWRNFKIVCVAGFLGFLVLLGWFAKDTYDYLKDIQHKAALCQELKCDDVAAMAEKLELPVR